MPEHQPSTDPSPAELFDRFFGPSLFSPWARDLIGRARPEPGDRVLDLACATGVLAREVAHAMGADVAITGVDIDPAMLAVARARAAAETVDIDWREGDATDLDLPDGQFDVVYCQQGVQFFQDPGAALAEVRRVLRDGGRLALNVWQPLPRQPVYDALLRAEAEYLDVDIAAVAAPFMFGEDTRLRELLVGAGLHPVDLSAETMDVEFGDPDTFVMLTLMAGAAVMPEGASGDPERRQALVEAVSRRSEDVLARYRNGATLRFPMSNYVAICRA